MMIDRFYLDIGTLVEGSYFGQPFVGQIIKKRLTEGPTLGFPDGVDTFYFCVKFKSPMTHLLKKDPQLAGNFFFYNSSNTYYGAGWWNDCSINGVITKEQYDQFLKENPVAEDSKTTDKKLDLEDIIIKKASRNIKSKTECFLEQLANLLHDFGVRDVRVHDKFGGLSSGIKDFFTTLVSYQSHDYTDYKFEEGMIGKIRLPLYLWDDEIKRIKDIIIERHDLNE